MKREGVLFEMFRTKVARRLVLALVLTGVLPLLAALAVAFALLEFSFGVGLNTTVQQALRDDVPLYGALFDAKKGEYRAVAHVLASELHGRDPSDADLTRLLERHAELAVLGVEELPPKAVEDEEEVVDPPAGAVLHAVTSEKPPLGRAFDVREPLGSKRVLHAQFRLPQRFDDGLVHTRELAETYAAIRNARSAIIRGLLFTFIGVVLLVLIGAAVLAGIIARSITRKVAILADAAREAAAGDLGIRVTETWYDELGDLARAFNQMLGEISESRDRIVYLEKISGWQEVARRLAHEIKNPLTPMVLAVQELAEKVPAQPESYARLVRTAREIVEEEASTLRRLVQEFSEFARLPDVHPEATDLVALAHDYAESARDVAAVADLTVDVPQDAVWAMVDRALFRRVLQNLVANAVEAQGGFLTPDAPAPSTRPRVVMRIARAAAGTVAVDVDDAGPGVPAADRVRIFEPYVTGKRTGTGLGLAIVKKLVLQHGGTIAVTQSREGGASFQVRLPSARPEATLNASPTG
jgi:nitrogen fixation/metabolism regulation signal transduction histidine kinase